MRAPRCDDYGHMDFQFLGRARRHAPVAVLEQAQRELVSLPGVGMSVMEISHRSKTFEDSPSGAIADIRGAGRGAPASYRLLMLQGGASLQFSMVPMNFLSAGQRPTTWSPATWAESRIKEAKRVERRSRGGRRRPIISVASARVRARRSRLTVAADVHYTSNNTILKAPEWRSQPDAAVSR